VESLNPFEGRNLRWLLDTRVEARPDHPFLVWSPFDAPARTWSYAEFRRDVDRLAVGLAGRGIQKGDRVCVHLDNCPEFLLAWFALASLGAVSVTTNTRCSASELSYFLERSHAVALITKGSLLETVQHALRPSIRHLVVADLAERAALDTTCGGMRLTPLSSLMDQIGDPNLPVVSAMDEAGIQFTSGTTARPKGVVWTHANYLWGGKVSAFHEDLRPDDRHLTFLPLFHTNAQSYSVMAALWVGATVVLMPRFSASRFWEVAVAHEATWCATIPFALRALKKYRKPAGVTLRMWGNGLIARRWEKDYGIPILSWWGMTETITHGIVSEIHSPPRYLSMGVPAPEYELRMLDEHGVQTSGPAIGRLEIRGVRGVGMALGYLDDPRADAEAWNADNWFDTGDRVELHEDGWLSFVEREKDMLKIGGENVGALEIESAILRTPGVSEAAVIGIPDRMLDEVPVAFVIAESGDPKMESRILETCRAELADFKLPREIRFVDELPRATLEKVSKAALRDSLAKPE
jgi:crotonobetaine/carnitine-CoA ligase